VAPAATAAGASRHRLDCIGVDCWCRLHGLLCRTSAQPWCRHDACAHTSGADWCCGSGVLASQAALVLSVVPNMQPGRQPSASRAMLHQSLPACMHALASPIMPPTQLEAWPNHCHCPALLAAGPAPMPPSPTPCASLAPSAPAPTPSTTSASPSWSQPQCQALAQHRPRLSL
jgi:hypothetical protein